MLMMRDRRVTGILAVMAIILGALASSAPAQQVRRGAGLAQGHDHDHDHDGTYQGRPIADVMSFLGADWLLRDTRVREEQPDKMLDALEIKAGMAVADVGAGVGYHSLKLAERVGPTGVVYASDIQPQMLQMLIERIEPTGLTNIVPVMASHSYTGLPPGKVDLILMVDVYHEMANPERSVKSLREALKPGGRLVLVEYRGEDPSVPIKPEHKMTAAQVLHEVEPLGFRFVQNIDFLPWQHILIFEKPAEGGQPATAAPAPEAGR